MEKHRRITSTLKYSEDFNLENSRYGGNKNCNLFIQTLLISLLDLSDIKENFSENQRILILNNLFCGKVLSSKKCTLFYQHFTLMVGVFFVY